MTRASMVNLRLFQDLCGRDNMRNVVLVTTRWNSVDAITGTAREKELREADDFWGRMIANGCGMVRYDGTIENATKLVTSIIKYSPIVVKLQKELVIDKKALVDTAVGASLHEEIIKMKLEHKTAIERLEKRLEVAEKKGKLLKQCLAST
jgi:pentatricopeptide repeat protein